MEHRLGGDAGEHPRSPDATLTARAARGEEIVIARSGKPLAKMVAFEHSMAPRMPGSAKGRLVITPTFDVPLPKQLQAEFER